MLRGVVNRLRSKVIYDGVNASNGHKDLLWFEAMYADPDMAKFKFEIYQNELNKQLKPDLK